MGHGNKILEAVGIKSDSLREQKYKDNYAIDLWRKMVEQSKDSDVEQMRRRVKQTVGHNTMERHIWLCKGGKREPKELVEE